MILFTAAATILAIEYMLSEYKNARAFYVKQLKNASIHVYENTATINGIPATVKITGQKELAANKTEAEYYPSMVWRAHEEERTDEYVFTTNEICAPAVKIGKYYVIIIPPQNRFYLRIYNDIELAETLDKILVHQDPDDVEVEFHYVAGKSKNAMIEFESRGVRQVLAKADGIPFQKLKITAGSCSEPILLLLEMRDKSQGFKQPYSNYLELLNTIGGEIAIAKGRLIAVLEYSIESDKRAETDAEFVYQEDSGSNA